MKHATDFHVTHHGSVLLVEPLNESAHAHLADNVGDEAQWLGWALAVEPRYAPALVEALREDGWTVA